MKNEPIDEEMPNEIDFSKATRGRRRSGSISRPPAQTFAGLLSHRHQRSILAG